MIRKFFPRDKNYLLVQAQQELEHELLSQLVSRVKTLYESKINPLGLLDSFSLKIKNYQPSNLEYLHEFYEKLSAIYRFKFGDNQLEFLWDGGDHSKHYQSLWIEIFDQWMGSFCQHELFIQAVLDLTVFLPKQSAPAMTENRMNHFIEKYFEVRLHSTKGIIPFKHENRKTSTVNQRLIGKAG